MCPQQRAARPTEGAALVIAVIILAGMLMLGLPFLFSQSVALSGSFSFAARQGTHSGVTTSLDLAKAVATAGIAWRNAIRPTDDAGDPDPDYTPATVLDADINDAFQVTTADAVIATATDIYNPQRIDLRPYHPFLLGEEVRDDLSRPRFGASLEDEGGKLDVNAMDAAIWRRLLLSTGIEADAGAAATQGRNLANLRFDKWDGDPDREHQYIEDLAELVEAGLSVAEIDRLRPYLTFHGQGQGREERLDLGSVVTGGKKRTIWVTIFNTKDDHQYRVRVNWGHLLHGSNNHWHHTQGNGGDKTFRIGTRNMNDFDADPSTGEVQERPSGGSWSSSSSTAAIHRWHDDLRVIFDGIVENQLTEDSVLVLNKDPDSDAVEDSLLLRLDPTFQVQGQLLWANGFDNTNPLHRRLDEFIDIYWDPDLDRVRFRDTNTYAAAKEILPAVNLHHAPLTVMEAITGRSLQQFDRFDYYQPVGTELEDWWPFLAARRRSLDDPSRFVERIPLDVRSWSIVGITARTAAGDRRDQPTASRHSRRVLQFGDQIDGVTMAWQHQVGLELLRRRGQTSRLVSWPNALNRVVDDPSDPLSRQLPAGPGVDAWLEPEPLNPIDHPLNNDDSGSGGNPTGAFDTGLAWDWRLPLGSAGALPAEDWLDAAGREPTDQVTNTGTGADSVQNPFTPADVQVSDIRPDGLPIAGKTLAYGIENDAGILQALPGRDVPEVAARHGSLWIRFETEPDGPVTILEARAPISADDPSVNTSVVSGDPQVASDNQNLFHLFYDPEYAPTGNVPTLVLALANTSIEHVANDPLTMRNDNPDTWDVDERSLGWSDLTGAPSATAASLAPARPANRVEFRYRVNRNGNGFETDTWYHLQWAVAHDRPGGQNLVVGGVVGADAIHKQSFSDHGDHYTWPSLRLVHEATNSDPVVIGGITDPNLADSDHLTAADAGGGSALSIDRVAVMGPPGVPVDQILPARGFIRIDDEYMSYESLEVTADGQPDILLGVRRGRRVNTWQGEGNEFINWPVLQEHAAGALVVPGGYQYTAIDGRFLRGHTSLTHNLDGVRGQGFGIGDALNATFYDITGEVRPYAHVEEITNDSNLAPELSRFRTWSYVDSTVLPRDPPTPLEQQDLDERDIPLPDRGVLRLADLVNAPGLLQLLHPKGDLARDENDPLVPVRGLLRLRKYRLVDPGTDPPTYAPRTTTVMETVDHDADPDTPPITQESKNKHGELLIWYTGYAPSGADDDLHGTFGTVGPATAAFDISSGFVSGLDQDGIITIHRDVVDGTDDYPREFLQATLVSLLLDKDQDLADDAGDLLDPAHFLPANGALQLVDGANDSIEWVRYDELTVSATAGVAAAISEWGFPFLNHDPTASFRGSQRTAFAGDPLVNYVTNSGPPDNLYPPLTSSNQNPAIATVWGSAFQHTPTSDPQRPTTAWPGFLPDRATTVLPVQGLDTTIASSDNFEAGDVVTLVPADMAHGTPTKMTVRFAANDGYPTEPDRAGSRWDTKNEWFAFTTQVEDSVPDPSTTPVTFVFDRGWAGDDLSPTGNQPQRRGLMPRLDAWQTAWNGDDARITICSADTNRHSSAATPEVVLDAVAAGELDTILGLDGNAAYSRSGNGSRNLRLGGPRVTAFYEVGTDTHRPLPQIPDPNSPTDPSNPAGLPIDVDLGGIDPDDFGLLYLDGEVFAYRRLSRTRVRLIARGLMGSEPTAHAMSTTSINFQSREGTNTYRDQRVTATLEVMPLPIGPVDQVSLDSRDRTASPHGPGSSDDTAILSPVYRGQLFTATELARNAEHWMVASPDGRTIEVLATPDGQVVPWLRGLYHTTITDWAGDNEGAAQASLGPMGGTLASIDWSDEDKRPVLIGVHHIRYPSALPGENPFYDEPPTGLPVAPGGSLDPTTPFTWTTVNDTYHRGVHNVSNEAEWEDRLREWRGHQLRSRTFAWVNLPLRLYQIEPQSVLVDLEQISGFQVVARALATGFSWDRSRAARVDSASTDPVIDDDVFRRLDGSDGNPGLGDQASNDLPPDGAEVRLHWHYDPSDSPQSDYAQVMGRPHRARPKLRRAQITALVETLTLEASEE